MAEFSPATLGGRLGLSTHAARDLMADALDLSHRLPRLWERVQGLEVKVSYARFVAGKTRDLTAEQAGYVDERVVESADGRIPWSRFELLVEAAVKADPEAAAARDEAERRRQFANPTASDEDGMRGFYIRGPFATIARLDAMVAFFAAALLHLGDQGSQDERAAPVPPRDPSTARAPAGDHDPSPAHWTAPRSGSPPPDQDLHRMGRPATLPRHLRLARPLRRLLSRRPHRHPPPRSRRTSRLTHCPA